MIYSLQEFILFIEFQVIAGEDCLPMMSWPEVLRYVNGIVKNHWMKPEFSEHIQMVNIEQKLELNINRDLSCNEYYSVVINRCLYPPAVIIVEECKCETVKKTQTFQEIKMNKIQDKIYLSLKERKKEVSIYCKERG